MMLAKVMCRRPDGPSFLPLDSYSWLVIGIVNSQRVIDCDAKAPRDPFQNARRSDATGHLRAAVPRRRPDGRGPDGSGRGLATRRLKASRGLEAGRAGARPPRRSPDAL